MKVDLKNCPFCSRGKAQLTIAYESSDATSLHTIECDWNKCLTFRRVLSGYSPDYSVQLRKFEEDWNTMVEAILKRKEEVK